MLESHEWTEVSALPLETLYIFARLSAYIADVDRNGPCKSRWLGYFVDREVGAIW